MGKFSEMNLAMTEKINNGEAIDLSDCLREGRHYVVPEDKFCEGMDYCDINSGWIWSLGRRKSDGKILASLSTDLYGKNSRDIECIWLR